MIRLLNVRDYSDKNALALINRSCLCLTAI